MKGISITNAFQLALAFVLAALGFTAMQATVNFVEKGLAESQQLRLASAQCAEDGAHFSGCSSIL